MVINPRFFSFIYCKGLAKFLWSSVKIIRLPIYFIFVFQALESAWNEKKYRLMFVVNRSNYLILHTKSMTIVQDAYNRLHTCPQFQLLLWFSPSLLSSPFAKLCLLLYVTKSAKVKPSCAQIKLILFHGFLPPPCKRIVRYLTQYAKRSHCSIFYSTCKYPIQKHST